MIRDYGAVAERRARLGDSGEDARNAQSLSPDARLERTRNQFILSVEGIKVAADALPRAGGSRMRALEVRVRVVRRSGQGGGEGRSRRQGRVGVVGSLGDRSVVRGSRYRWLGVSFLVGIVGARRCPGPFDLGRNLTASGVDRIWTGGCGSGRRDRIPPFPRTLGAPASYTRRLARARSGYNPSSLRTLALTLRAGLSLPLPFTVCSKRVLQLLRATVSVRVVHERSMET